MLRSTQRSCSSLSPCRSKASDSTALAIQTSPGTNLAFSPHEDPLSFRDAKIAPSPEPPETQRPRRAGQEEPRARTVNHRAPMSVARFSVNRRVAVAMLSLAIVVLGLLPPPRLAVALLPTFAPPVVSVSVAYSNVSPETIETSVTRPIENAVSRVSGIDILESNSFEGLSTVRAQFEFGTDINVAAVDVQQQVSRIRASLPNDPALQEPQIAKADPNATPVLTLEVTDTLMTQSALSDLIVNSLSDEFASVHGVGSLGVSGVAQRAIVIEPDEHKLAGFGLTIDTLLQRIKNENVELPAGVIQIGRNEYGIRTSALFTTPGQIADTVLATTNGMTVRLRDV